MIDDTYPVVLRLRGRAVLVVGGGEVARRKAQALVAAGAVVTVVAPEVVTGFVGVTFERRRYESTDVVGKWLVVAATDDPVVQQQVFDDCERAGVFCNAVDDPERCSFILPAVERRGPVIVAVSTSGRSPALAQQLRDRLAAALPADVEELAERVAAERDAIRAAGGSTENADWSGLLE